MRIAIAAGGTGGHIFPALSVVEALRAADPGIDVRFFGPDNRGERRFVEPLGIPFERVEASAVRGRGPIALAKSAWQITRGMATAFRVMRAYRPDAVFSTGGYASFPQSVAARLLRKPLVVFLPDVAPGWAVRAESFLATRMATTTDAALRHLPPEKTAVTGYPVRPEYFALTRAAARQALGIHPDERVLLVAGASQGAQAINEAVLSGVETLTSGTTLFHVTGESGIERARDAAACCPRYHPSAFRPDLPTLMRAADLAVMRAGASILGELPAAVLPSILIPGTFAGGHQRDNARWLADAGAAVLLEEAEIERLVPLALDLLGDDERLADMAASAAKLARPDAATRIAGIIAEVGSR